MRPLSRAFYARPVLVVARALLGRTLVHDTPEGRIAGIVVEVEAYRGADDPASHAYRGPTARNAVMFGAPGRAYVYWTYGMHHCLNLVAGSEGTPAAVLIRALQPCEGLALMSRNRGGVPLERLARGPGCVARALGVSRLHNGLDLTRGPLWVAGVPPRLRAYRVRSGPRVGIRAGSEKPWRFFLEGHRCVSGPRRRDLTGGRDRTSAASPHRGVRR